MLLAAIAAVAWLPWVIGAAASTPISDSAELLAALSALHGTGNTTLLLEQSVRLSVADTAGYGLPFIVSPGETVRLLGAGMPQTSLDFGEIPLLLDVNSGGTLVLENLNISGTADQDAPVPGSNTTIQLLSVWPTITGESGAAVEMSDVIVTLHPSERCSAQNIASAVQQLRLAAAPGSADATSQGLTAYFANFALPLPIVNASGGVDGAIAFKAVNTNMTCQPAAAAAPPAPAPAAVPASSGGSSGLPAGAIAGIAVGTAAGAALLAGAAWWLLRRRRLGCGVAAVERSEEAGGRKDIGQLSAESEKELGSSGTPGSGGLLGRQRPAYGSSSGTGGSKISGAGSLEGSLGSPNNPLQTPTSLFKSRVGAIEGLQLGAVLGRGAFGHVHKGRWKGSQVAVKIVPIHVGPGEHVDLEHEPLLSLSLSHPNVLAAYKMCVVRLLRDGEGGSGTLSEGWGQGAGAAPAAAAAAAPAAAQAGRRAGAPAKGLESAGLGPSSSGGSIPGSMGGSGSAGRAQGKLVPSLTNKSSLVEVVPAQAVLEPGLYETWLVSEFADGGSLADAIAAGRFAGDMESIMLCLLDVARGLEYLHSSNILHGDLKSQNVLLRSARADRRGFVCKLCDFGLSRLLSDHQTSLQTAHFGTVSHAAPELLQHGRLTRSSDVYAFGVVMWEMVSGERPFREMPPLQIMFLTTQQGYRLPVPEGCPPQLAALMQRCWDTDPQARPAAAAVVEELIQIGGSLLRGR
ncbi:hypothetical protein ABPG75_001276 [Micractinium tetrahymenae]